MTRVPIADLDKLFAATPPPDGLAWLHDQSRLSNAVRRRRKMPELGTRIIDVGSGLGQVAADLAASFPQVAEVIGLDADPLATLYAQEWTRTLDLPLQFLTADLYHWLPDIPVTGITCRFVLQHLSDVPGALRQFYRWLEPGGMLLIEDVDEGYSVDWPPFPLAWIKALEAFMAHQNRKGGDREVGRKLGPGLLDAGFQAMATVEVATQTSVLAYDDPSLSWIRQRIEMFIPAFQKEGLLTASGWADAKAALAEWLPRPVYQSSASVVWVAQKPVKP